MNIPKGWPYNVGIVSSGLELRSPGAFEFFHKYAVSDFFKEAINCYFCGNQNRLVNANIFKKGWVSSVYFYIYLVAWNEATN